MFASSSPQFLEDALSGPGSRFDSNALYISLKSQSTKGTNTLIDTGPSVSFLDSRFALQNNLQLSNLKTPLRRTLFNGSQASNGLIYQCTDLEVEFPYSSQHTIRFLITTLDRSTAAVLGYSWLHQWNPTINWVSPQPTFRSSLLIALNSNAFRSPIPHAIPELSTPTSTSVPAGPHSPLLPPFQDPPADLYATATLIPFPSSILPLSAS